VTHEKSGQFAALAIPDIRYLLSGNSSFTMASKALAVIIGFQIYKITGSTAALGWLGLVEAIPAIAMAPLGGYVADRFNRRTILLITRAVSVLCAVALALLSAETLGGRYTLPGLYAMVFLAGFARGFAEPAGTALEAQVVPRRLTVNATSWLSSAWITCAIIGPAASGFALEYLGASRTYGVLAVLYAVSWLSVTAIARPDDPSPRREPLLKSIRTGWHFVWKNQPLLAAMSLDMVAVFFGGVVALLPVFASDILHVGAKGLGFLNAAPSVGALLISLVATRRPPVANAGRNLLCAVAGFGAAILVFAFSRSFALSMAALFVSGIFDGVSMVVRRSMLRLLSPENMRGRVASANSIFITASNELGAFESGMGATLVGTIPCVALGGGLTLIVVMTAAKFAPELRLLRFNDNMERV
jgi:MFS family permease